MECKHDFDSGYDGFSRIAMLYKCADCGMYATDYLASLEARCERYKSALESISRTNVDICVAEFAEYILEEALKKED